MMADRFAPDSIWPPGGGEMARRIRAFDWASTPLGPIASWPSRLKGAVEMMLALGCPAHVCVGEGWTHLYNDSYAPLIGAHHPAALGDDLRKTFAESDFRSALSCVFSGETVTLSDQPDPFGLRRAGESAWFDLCGVPVRDESGAVFAIFVLYKEMTDRVLAQAARADVEQRQAFLLKLSDALRALSDPIDIMAIASESIGRHLGVGRCGYGEVDATGAYITIERDWTDGVMQSARGTHELDSFGPELMATYREGRTLIIEDVLADVRARGVEAAYEALGGLRASIAVPLIKDGRWVVTFYVQQASPRRWTPKDVALVHEVAERTWAAVERARAERALSQSEEKYRNLFESIDEGVTTVDVLFSESGQAVDFIIGESNPALIELTGLTDTIGKKARELLPNLAPEFFARLGRVAQTGQSERFEQRVEDLDGSWFDCYAARIGGQDSRQVVVVYNNVTERKRAEQELRESEERQVFLLRLSDRLRGESSSDAIASLAVHMLAEQLRLDRCYAVALQPAEDRAEISNQFCRPEAPPVPVTLRMSAFPEALRQTFERTLVFADIARDPELTELDKQALAALDLGALIFNPLRRGATIPMWGLVAGTVQPRRWRPGEIALVEEVTERTWTAMQRAQSEAALRASEARFARFAASSSDALWIRDAETLAMEYASPAMRSIYGSDPDALLGDVKRWAALVIPDDRAATLACIEQAKAGEAVVHEFRIQRPADGAFRWIRSTEFPLLDEQGRVERIGGIARDVTERKLSTEHQTVLLSELQHRVRNIMAIIRSITARTGEFAESVQDYASLLSGRLLAMARVQAMLTRGANVRVGIRTLVHDEVSVQAHHPGQYELVGPDLDLSPKAAEILTLAVHELATNAVKYGAFSVPSGHVTVRWATFELRGRTWLGFDWTEEGVGDRLQTSPAPPRRHGFGSELIELRVPYELGGRGKIVIDPGGARCHLEFPLKEGASILETGAPQRATVFGGALDMTGAPDLGGRCVLVVEDDYYLATDAARALLGAGAEVLGPCATEEAARAELTRRRPDAAVVDINLGPGPSFELARSLRELGVPLVFITGYDPELIPEELSDVTRLAKPVQLRQLVGAIAKLVSSSAS